MKTLSLMAFLCLCFASCKKATTQPTQSLIVGKWYEKKIVLQQSTNGSTPITETSNFTNPTNYVVFNSNGTGSFTKSDTTSNFNYSLSGSNLTLSPNTQNITYTINSLLSSGFTMHEVYSYTVNKITVSAVVDDYFIKQ